MKWSDFDTLNVDKMRGSAMLPALGRRPFESSHARALPDGVLSEMAFAGTLVDIERSRGALTRGSLLWSWGRRASVHLSTGFRAYRTCTHAQLVVLCIELGLCVGAFACMA